MGVMNWLDKKLTNFAQGNEEIYKRYANAPDRELLQYFKIHKKNGEIFDRKFLVIGRILQERGLIDGQLNIIE